MAKLNTCLRAMMAAYERCRSGNVPEVKLTAGSFSTSLRYMAQGLSDCEHQEITC